MADELSNFNIFRLPENASLVQMGSNFRNFPELASPLAQVRAGQRQAASIPPYNDSGSSILPVFTDPRLLAAPGARKPTLPFLLMLFNAPAADLFAFNPATGAVPAPGLRELRLNKHQLSVIAGFLQMSAPPQAGADLKELLKNEADFGNLHKANAIASLMPAGGEPYGPYAETLINLGLLQEAYNYVKAAQTPEFIYYRASILRRSGDPVKARQWLESMPDGTPFEDKKRLELAWLSLEEGKPDEAINRFRPLSENSFEKIGALFGLGSALMKKTRAKAETDESLAAFASALKFPSPLTPRIFFQMGNLHFRTGNYSEAEACYRKASEMWPAVQSRANLALTMIRSGKSQEAAELINDIALTDPDSAGRLLNELENNPGVPPSASAVSSGLAETAGPKTTPQPAMTMPPTPRPAFSVPRAAPAAPMIPPSVPAQSAPAQPPQDPQPLAGATVSLEAAAPRKVITSRTSADPVTFNQVSPAAEQAPPPLKEEEARKDDFLGGAFKLASSLSEELRKKVDFNESGLNEVSAQLVSIFVQKTKTPEETLEALKNASAFLCYFLQKKHGGRLVKLPDFEPWSWPVVFNAPKRVTTYPIQRLWKLLTQGTNPEQDFLTAYLRYIEEELQKARTGAPQGVAAVQKRVQSHPERILDTKTEHERIMLLTAALEETAQIELAQAGVAKIENALKNNFRPDIPPTVDGWKLLRCYGHIMAEIMIRDFRAAWYNTDGNDGEWSMQLPCKIFVFPFGKVYKTASNRESLTSYYDILMAESLKAFNAEHSGKI